jgi:hypothetical protein
VSRPDSSGTDDEVVFFGHSSRSLNYLVLIIGNDLDLLKLDTEVKTMLGEEIAVRVAVSRSSVSGSSSCLC